MKKHIISLVCLALLLSLCCCTGKKATVAGAYEDEERMLSFAAKLYSDAENDEYALLFRPYGQARSTVAVGSIGGENTVLYTAPEGCYIYELYVNEGIISFFERTSYTDNDYEKCTLKVVDRASGEVFTPYSKLISADGDVQSRFVCVYDRCVYYLTASLQLGQCRVMRYSLDDNSLTELAAYDLTENPFTYNHSSTFIAIDGFYLSASYVNGTEQYINIYDLRDGSLYGQKKLPDDTGIVYHADFDVASGYFALFYSPVGEDGTLGAETVGVITLSGEEIAPIYTAGVDMYINRETVHLHNNLVYFTVQDASRETVAEMYSGYLFNIADTSRTRFSRSFDMWIDADALYNLCFDEEKGEGRVTVTRTPIVGS